MLPAGSEAPVTVEEMDMDWQPTLEMAYGLGFEAVKLFCLGDFAEGKITVSGAVDTGLCAADVGALIIPADGPFGEAAITSVKTARFIHGVKTWFNFQRVPNALYKLRKANKALLRFKYVVKGETKPISKELSKGAIQGASDLGIIWQKGAHGETLDAFGNLLKNYADDSGAISYKVRELIDKKVLVKDMERVYENGGDLKTTINLVEKSEDGKSIIRWLDEGTDRWGWTKIWKKHITGEIPGGTLFKEVGVADDMVEKAIFDTVKNPEVIKSGASGKMCYFTKAAGYAGKYVLVVVDPTGSINTAYPVGNLDCY